MPQYTTQDMPLATVYKKAYGDKIREVSADPITDTLMRMLKGR
jgi:hypothetical protein